MDGSSTSWGPSDHGFRSVLSLGAPEVRVIARAPFDEILALNAERCGVSRVRDAALKVTPARGFWTLDLRTMRSVRARLIVDCTGRASRLVRKHGATHTAIDELLVWSAKCKTQAGPPVIEIDATERGWIFTAPTVMGDRFVAFFGDKDLLNSGGERHLRGSWPKEAQRSRLWRQYAGYFDTRTVTVELAATGYLDYAVLPGLIAVGDAAQTLDPLSSQGILSALQDAESAAEAIAAAVGGDVEHLSRHEAARRGRFCQYLLQRQAQYKVESRFETSPFWRRRQQPVGETYRSHAIT